MAPLVADLQTWVTGGGPTLTVLSLVFLFIIIINLINLCTSCKKQSFELEHEGAGVERSSSTLVKVVKLEDALAGRENAAIEDEQELSTIPEANGEYTSWRNHTTPQPSGLPEERVGNGAPTEIAVTNGGSADMDGTATARHELHAIPVIAPHKEVESIMQSAPLAVSVAVAAVPPIPSESEGNSLQDWARVPSKPTANHTGQVAQEHPNLLQVQEVRSQHEYETISEVLKQGTPELSDSHKEPPDVPSYQFVTQLEPYATSSPDLTHPSQHTPAPHTSTTLVELEEIADPEDKHFTAMYARVSRRIKCPTPPPVPPPDEEEEEEEEVEEIAPPLPERTLDTDDTTSEHLDSIGRV